MTMVSLQNGFYLRQSPSFSQSPFLTEKTLRNSSVWILHSHRMSKNIALWSRPNLKNSTGGQWLHGPGSLRAKVGGKQSDDEQEIDGATDDILGAGESKQGGAKGFGTPPKKPTSTEKKKASKSSFSSSNIRRTPPTKPLIGTEPIEPQKQQLESAIVASLAILIGVIFVEGLVLAGSGFLPEDLDALVVKYLYPSYTPSVGVFLVAAASYGLWKYFDGGTGLTKK